MSKHRNFVALTLALCIAALALPAAAQGPRFLTAEKSNADPLSIAMSYIRGMDKARLAETDLADLAVVDRYVSKHNGTTHIYLRQMVAGIEVINSHTAVNVAADGRIINLDDNLVRSLKAAVNAKTAALSAEKAIGAAAKHLGLKISAPLTELDKAAGPAMEGRFSEGGISQDAIPVRLVYYATGDGAVRLGWDLSIRQVDTADWWSMVIDAVTGKVLFQNNWTRDDSYRVFATPKESPSDGSDTLEVDPADDTASPFGWHDVNGAAGADFTDTRGNNVQANTDLNANNSCCTGEVRPDGGASLIFDFPYNLTLEPSGYREGAVTNLFYHNNIIHDMLFYYGFDEASGNFQSTNYSGAPGGQDPVLADAQDGSGTDNANFATPPDGFAPRMQMYVWLYPFSQQVNVSAPVAIAGTYSANPSADGGLYTGPARDLEIVVDGTAPTDDGCETITNDLTGNIALLRWNQGACNSSVFVANAAAAGAAAVIIIDNTVEPRTSFGGSTSIPSVSVGSDHGQLFVDTINGGDTVTADIEDSGDPTPDRDSDLDAGVIYHEFCHGLSNRLTGGRTNANCLTNQQQAGEGWSDFCALSLTAVNTDAGTDARGVGTYLIYEPPTGAGIREFPYSTDLGVNPHTYEDIGSVSVPHGVGSVWNAMVWEVYWNLTDLYGFDSDLYNGVGGNNLAIQLVVDGLKLQPCNPTFVEARDAILSADNALTGGANQCLIWDGFAKRGLGAGATEGGGGLNVTNDFTVPAECQNICGNGSCQPEFFEDCNTCPSDCDGGSSSGAVCGNGICETALGDDEDCETCPQDCNGVQGGKPSNRYCCGPVPNSGTNPVDCGDPRCTGDGNTCTTDPSPSGSFCCGDLTCQAVESCANCSVDCAMTETGACEDGADNNCDGNVDCDDFFCRNDPACAGGGGVCLDPGEGQPCDANTNCCSGVGNCTGGKPANRVCN